MNMFRYSSVIGALLLACFVANARTDEWLTALPDDVMVRKLSIPGAHDAGTGNGFASGSAFLALFSGVTQSLSLDAQWDAGVRAFDLRPTYKADADGQLQIYHGILETKVSMKAALQTLVDKLAESPGEMAVVLMRHESDSDSNSDQWAPAMARLLDEFDEHIAAFSPTMTLGDARGKILVMTRDSFTSDKAATITGWSHSENFDDQKKAVIALKHNRAALYTQDYYECSSTESKYQAVTTLLDYSTTNTSTTTWVINHVSGYTGSGTNSDVSNLAQALNVRIADYLDTVEPGRTGIVMMDFAGATSQGGNTLVNSIIAQNDKYIETDSSSIDSVNIDGETDGYIYDLSGRIVGRGSGTINSLSKGLYIYNGHKIIVQ